MSLKELYLNSVKNIPYRTVGGNERDCSAYRNEVIQNTNRLIKEDKERAVKTTEESLRLTLC